MKVFLMIIFAVLLVLTIPSSFAEVSISIPKGTDTPGCQDVDLCYIPSPITINVGDVVEWINNDSAVHTVTSGSPDDGPDGIIYSPLMKPDEIFAFKFDEAGTYPYFCMVHPWMQGLVIAQVVLEDTQSAYDLSEQRITSDGSTMILIKTNIPQAGSILPIELRFIDKNDVPISHMNYDITVIQDQEEVLFVENAHSMDGTAEHGTRSLESDNPVDVEIAIRGIYPIAESSQPVEEVIEFQQVPEFGLVATLVLGIGILTGLYLLNKYSSLRLTPLQH